MNPWVILGLAIVAEIVATSFLRASDGLTRLGPAIVVVAGYATAIYLLSLSLREIPVGIAYAVWSGIGIMLIAVVGWVALDQKLDTAAVIGMALIVAGVVVINLFSTTTALS